MLCDDTTSEDEKAITTPACVSSTARIFFENYSELCLCPVAFSAQFSKYSVSQKTHLWFQYKVFTLHHVTVTTVIES